jgi:hypothetical protein
MNCSELNKSILKFSDKELTPEKEAEFKQHLAECNDCAKMYTDVADTYNMLNSDQEIEPKAFFTESVMNKIELSGEKESIFDVTFDIAISNFFKKFAYTGVAFIIALFILLYSTNNLSLLNNNPEEDDFSTNTISSVFFDNF